MYPPPPHRNGKVEISGQCDISVLTDVIPTPPPGMGKLKSQVNVTFWFWLMYPPPGRVGFCLIPNFSNLFPPEWLRITWNGQFHPIHNFFNLFPLKWLRMTQNGQFCLICNFSYLFPLKWLRMTQDSQFCLIHNFSNLFPPKWLTMTLNGQFCIAKIKYTLIQGNFYDRLPFYMDSCALSPMASLLD